MSFHPDEIATVTPEQKKSAKTCLPPKAAWKTTDAYTPFGLKMTIEFPGTIGAANWPGMSFDPKLGYLFVNTNNFADVGKLMKNPKGPSLLTRGKVPGATMLVFGTMISSGHVSNRPGDNFGQSMPTPAKWPGRFHLELSLSSMQKGFMKQEA